MLLLDAWYGPGITIDAPPDTNEDLAIPEREEPALDQVAAEVQRRLLRQSTADCLERLSLDASRKD